MGMRSDSAGVEQQLEQAWAWLTSADGHNTAARLAASYRVSLDAVAGGAVLFGPDDLIIETYLLFWGRVQRHGAIADFRPGAYLSKTMQNLLRSALRGRRPWAQAELVVDHADAVVITRPRGEPSPGEDLFEMRTEIERVDAPDWAKAGALAFVAVSAYPDLVPAWYPVPRPRGGASPVEAGLWVALWFAGRRDGLFPEDGENAPTSMRKARSRAAATIRDVVERAAAQRYGRADLDRQRSA